MTKEEIYSCGLGEGTVFYLRELCAQIAEQNEMLNKIREQLLDTNDKLSTLRFSVTNLRRGKK